jgi:peptidoglycan/xylan/chitin deacetylase (PgdA/CDA1 family)/CelD/BcsL family acetyltransferase involved in cellulose biosynthesis
MRIELHHSWEELQSLSTAWDQLLSQSSSDTIFLTWEWCAAWWNAYGRGRRLFVLSARDGDALIGIAPFYLDSQTGWYGKWACLRIIGAGSGDSDYLDCFALQGKEREFLRAVLDFLESEAEGWNWMEIESAPQESSCMTTLGSIAAERGWSFTSEDMVCTSVPLPASWHEYLRILNPRVRTKVRSALAGLDQLRVSPAECQDASDLDTWLLQLFETHTRRWQKRYRSGVFGNNSRRLFYGELSRTVLQKGWLAFHRLAWGERALALQYGFRYRGRLYVLQEGYDPSFDRLRPGTALRAWVMKQAIEDGLGEYDFLAGAAQHKLDWGGCRKISRTVRIAKKANAIRISMATPSMSQVFRQNAAKLLPQPILAWRARLRRSRLAVGAMHRPNAPQASRWLLSRLYTKTPFGILSRYLADRWIWRSAGPGHGGAFSTSTSLCTIFRYHRVNDNYDRFFEALPLAEFEAQMNHLARYFEFVSLDQLATGDLPTTRKRRWVAVTFDDGYRDNFVHAFPILNRMKIPATIFLTTGCIESGQLTWYDQVRLAFKLTLQARLSLQDFGGPSLILGPDDRRVRAMQVTLAWLRTTDNSTRITCLPELFRRLRVPGELNLPGTMLAWGEVRQMSRAGISFGAHTVTHPVLESLPVSMIEEEIVRSKQTVESRLQKPVRHFAYPFGKPADFGASAKQVVRDAGFQTAVTTVHGFNGPDRDLLELRRLSLAGSDAGIFGLKLDWSRMQAAPAQ